MQFMKHILAAVLITSLTSMFVACGGGSSTPTLFEAYQRIEGGMTVGQVKVIVNSGEPSVGGPYFDGTSSMQWLGVGPSILDVTYNPGGFVIQKIYDGVDAPTRLSQKYP